MFKALKIFQYAYLIIAAVLVYETIISWNTDRNKAYFTLFFAALAVFIYFFRKRFHKKIEDRRKQ